LEYINYNYVYDNAHIQGGPKNYQTCFSQNFVKSPPNVIIFGSACYIFGGDLMKF